MMQSLADVLDWHLERYPLMQAEDVYKLLHQGVYGPGHIIRSREQAQEYLDKELADLRRRCCMQSTDRVEPLDPEGVLVRVNLETLRDRGDATGLVLDVLIPSAEGITGDQELMRARLAEAVEWCGRSLPDQAEKLEQIAETAATDGYPAMHHSQVYETAYRPAYRVVKRELWDKVDTGEAGASGCFPPRHGDTRA